MRGAPVRAGAVRSAKRTVYQTCPNCKNFNAEDAVECYACGEALSPQVIEFQPVGAQSSEPDWRNEVAHRLEAYRERRRSIRADAAQNPFPFAEEEATEAPREPSGEETAWARPARRGRPEPASIPIHVEQPQLDFSADPAEDRPTTALLPVGELRERAKAAVLDCTVVAVAFAAFLAIFGGFAGELPLGKVPVAAYAAALYLFYALYFTLFTYFTGTTLGLALRGLTLASFEGQVPSNRQLLWRSFGYLLSAATLGLGFLWALWDEDTLTWQDRISQTYITAGRLPQAAPAGAPGR